jgi:hypothetical protein
MNILEPLKWEEIKFENIVCHKIIRGKKMGGKKIILIKYLNDGELVKFVFQTPKLKTHVSNSGLTVELLLTNKDEEFTGFINNLESAVKQLAQKNALSNESWFNFNDTNAFINFKRILRESNFIKLKLLNDEEFKTDVILEDKNMNLENGNLTSKIIVEFYGIWITENNNFGVILRPILVSFKEIKDKKYNYKFIDDSDSEEINIFDTEGYSHSSDIFLKVQTITHDPLSPNGITFPPEEESLTHTTSPKDIILKISPKETTKSEPKDIINSLLTDLNLTSEDSEE